MSFSSNTYHSAKCDGCDKQFFSDDPGDRDDLQDYLTRIGWTFTNGDKCPKCTEAGA